MIQIHIDYLGDLHCKITHGPTGQTIITDAPVDNQGKGEFISPTDMVAASIGSCVLTIMGIAARTNNINIEGSSVIVTKEMTNVPFRRIKTLQMDFTFVHPLDEKEFKIISAVPKTCPVTRSLSPDVEIITNYNFSE